MLSKFSITIDVLDESVTEAMPPDVRESNHINVQPSKEGGQSDDVITKFFNVTISCKKIQAIP